MDCSGWLFVLLAALVLTSGCADQTSQANRQGGAADAPVVEVVVGSTDTAEDLIQPEELVYRGGFRLPEPSGGSNWEYSGYAMTYYPDGDPDGPDDGYPGSLFAVGHDHHQMVSEISIPAPRVASGGDPAALNTATTLQPFSDVRGGFFGPLEIPRAGLEYLPSESGTGPGELHFAWGQHFEDVRTPSHGAAELDLSAPNPRGPWRLNNWTNYVTNDYLLEIPKAWADQNLPGYRLTTGRFRDGIWGGLGPTLLAYKPPARGQGPGSGGILSDVRPLILYGESDPNSPELLTYPDRKMRWFAEADEWSGGAWLTAGTKSALVLVGTKATGRNWYGFANGVEYPTSGDPNEPVPDVPPWPYDARGWWSEGVSAQVLFYRPADLAAVARGEREPWEPQPYAVMSIDPYLLDPGFDHPRQKRYLVGAVAFDRARGLFYVMERRADEEKCVVHVFHIGPDDA